MASDAPNALARMKQATRSLRSEVYALLLAMRHCATPWYAKALAACVVAYALSPIDLIPDPVPVLGYLDDLIIVPLGILAVRRMVPPDVLAECRHRAASGVVVPAGWRLAGLLIIGALWAASLLTCGLWIYRWWDRP